MYDPYNLTYNITATWTLHPLAEEAVTSYTTMLSRFSEGNPILDGLNSVVVNEVSMSVGARVCISITRLM